MKDKLALDKYCSTAIKGIAILFMMVHHGIGLPESWFEPGLGYGQTVLGNRMLFEWIGNPTKICVSTFALLTGYSYYKHNTPTFRYGIRKTVQVFLQYWLVLFLLFYPAGYFISGYRPGIRELVWDIFCLHNRAVSFSWYVLFYAGCMCSLPVLVKLFTGKWWIDLISLPVVFTAVLYGLDRIVIQKWYLVADVRDYFYWMPVVWVGYVLARYGVLEKVSRPFWGKKKWYMLPIFLLVPVARGACSEILRMNMDVLYAPLFVFACVVLLQERGRVFQGFYQLGTVSLYIWLIHAIFFWKETRRVFQPIAYGIPNPVLTIGIILGISFLLAWLFAKIWHILQMIKQKKQIDRKSMTGFLIVLGGLFVAFIFTGMYLTYAQDSIVINEVCSDNYSIGLNNGELCDYVELYNPSYVDVSLQGYSLSEIKDGKEKYVLGNVTIPGKSFLLIKFNGEAEAEDAANLQAPFKLSQKGESLYLHNASQEVIDFVQIPGLDYDEAYARVRDGRKEWSRSFCSPAESNVKKEIEEAVLFSQESGFYEEPFALELQSPKGGQIFYTLDGSVPDENSLLYTEPIWVTDISEQEDRYSDNPDMSDFFNSVFEEKSDKALVVRALHIDEEGKKSAVSEAVYFVGYQDKRGYEDVAVISIVADPQDLFGGERGIYVLGDDYKAGVEGAGPNYTKKGKEWERQAAITFFDEKHEKLFSQQCGVRIQGASKRFNSQKCLTINTGYRYGEPYLKEHILGEPYEISQMIMKGTAYYIPRDVLPYELVKERQIGIPNYRYSAVFLNGEYWGLYVLKEKYNGNYFEQHFGIDRDNVILLKQTLLEEGMSGEEMSYLDMVDFACTHDLTVPENYAYVCELMDVQNFIDYFCTQMYICNMDFSMRHNCYTWRSREVGDGIGEDGKWRWLLYDIDYSAWMDINTTYTINSFTGNMPWSDLTAIEDPLFQALMKNENFRRQFVTTFMDFVNSCFQTGKVLNIIDDYAEILEEPMRISMERFEYEAALDTMVDFSSVREFYENRTPYITGYLAEVFELQGQPATVQIENLEPEGGEITVNTICPDFTETGSFEGQYYTDYPITVTAIPKEGYRFAGWSGDIDTKEAGITLDLPKQGVLLLAEFEKE